MSPRGSARAPSTPCSWIASGLAPALPVGVTGPRWASYRGEAEAHAPWAVRGYCVIVPMYDAAGELRSVRALHWPTAGRVA